ncbi:MAG TPA: GxxExxY protein [Vicinamibacterales bacterium]|nr:GxxExxY protein [Vicinamibacterales bacterium]
MQHADDVAQRVIGAAINVHRRFGPGLLENAYTLCTAQELIEGGLFVEIQKPLPLTYRHLTIDRAYVLDLLVEESVIVEVKCVDAIRDVHVAQLLTYLRLTRITLGLIINFNVVRLKDGIRRVVNNHRSDDGRPR